MFAGSSPALPANINLKKDLIMETEFKVGDKVKSVYGTGIIEIISKNDTSYPISVRYKDGSILTYTLDGKQFRNSNDNSNITKVIWEVGQRVFSARYGWGVVDSFIPLDAYPLVVYFNVETNYKVRYKLNGLEDYNDKYPTLSFTNYILDKFSQDPKDATYEQIEPDFDWGCLSAWCNDWIAKDIGGIWYSYNGKPKLVNGMYSPGKNTYTRIHPDYCPKNSDKINWSNSLYKNPQYK